MDIREMNLKLVMILQEWDPFNIGEEGYDGEIEDVIQSVHDLHHPSDLAKKIQAIYEESFDQWIPLQECTKVSYKLLAVKMDATSQT
ncbi:hypothetical protein KP77_24500 [Jeotgalibacillus alimentarius]|uniref:DUF1871 domain-containing protein n=1 Tax=Jeotgalibacillus alimentarius TaxID=135826 RepID=A0A0C2VD60_9BACL|nr:DUF1871 family protein [Jeotgalibacillus alimentarius]KIL46882.1 hypothetical protein KP77_24500 [Jeotgalibacillus alimentarius]